MSGARTYKLEKAGNKRLIYTNADMITTYLSLYLKE
jgi:hypothetical protein